MVSDQWSVVSIGFAARMVRMIYAAEPEDRVFVAGHGFRSALSGDLVPCLVFRSALPLISRHAMSSAVAP